MTSSIQSRLVMFFVIVVAHYASSAIAADQKSKAVRINILPENEHCLVNDLELACSEVINHLLNRLRMPLDQSIVVSNKGKVNRAIIDRTERELQQAGFTDVTRIVVAFITEPKKQ
jgi:hypothetical protein